MIEAISIGTADHLPAIRRLLQKEFTFLQEEGIGVNVKEETRGTLTFLGCYLNNGEEGSFSQEEARNLFRHFVANALAEGIIACWEESLVKNIIHQHYHYFNQKERKKIWEQVTERLSAGEETRSGDSTYSLHRKSKILFKLLDYFESNSEIVVEGFIRFRLQEYWEELRELVDRAVDDLMLEREYKEFIRLLRYFLEVQEPKQKEIHVLWPGEKEFRLLDEQGRMVTTEELEEMMTDLSETDINCEDLLISALISLAPQEVHLHLDETLSNREAVETIQKVFVGRVETCRGCSLCKNREGEKGDHTNPIWFE